MTAEPATEPWQWTPSAIQAAHERLQEFAGTPHMHRRAVPGIGVDCVHLVAEALKASGVIDEFEMPPYRRTDGFLQAHNHIEELLMHCLHAECIRPDHATGEPVPFSSGDIVVFAVDRSINHVGFFLGGRIWHASWDHGTIAEDAWHVEPRIQALIKITHAGFKNEPSTFGGAAPIKRKHR
jgi:hypothetical protein